MWASEAQKKYPNIEFEKDINKYDAVIIFEDPTTFENRTYKVIEIYEPHGWFQYENLYIIYGHETIMILDEFGEIKAEKHTR